MFLSLSDKQRGILALLLAAFIFSLFSIFIREMSLYYGNFAQVAARMFVAFAIMFLINNIRKQAFNISRRDLSKTLLLGLSNAIGFSLFVIAILNLKIANGIFLLYAGTIISGVLAGHFWFQEKLNAYKVLALALTVIGIYIFTDPSLALTFGVVAGFCSGIFNTTSNSLRKKLKGLDRKLVLQFTFFFAGLATFITSFVSGETMIKELSGYSITLAVIFGILLIPIAYLMLYGFQKFDVNTGSVILSLELFFAAILAYVFFGETLTSKEIIGGMLIFLATALVSLNFKTVPESKTLQHS